MRLKKLKKKSVDKNEFAESLRKELMWRYWSKCEWELIISIDENNRVKLSPWVGSRDAEKASIDVTDDTSFDRLEFAKKHIESQIYTNTAKIDVYDQLMYRFDELVDYLWYTRMRYERRDKKFEKIK